MFRRIAVCLLPLAALAQPVAAQQLPNVPQTNVTLGDFFYASVGSFVSVSELPKMNFVTVQPGDDKPFSVSPTMVTYGLSAVVGYNLDRMDMPSFLGMAPRVELAANIGMGTARSSLFDAGPLPFLNNPLSGVISSGNCTDAPVCGTEGSIVQRTSFIDLGLRWRSDFAVGPAVTLTPLVGIVGGAQHRSIKGDISVFNSTDVNNRVRYIARENIDTSRIGGEIGLDATFRVAPAWSLHAGVNAALFMQRNSMRGQDCLSNSSNFIINDNCGYARSIVADRDIRPGSRVGGSLGVSYDIGWARLSLMGEGAFNGNVVGVDNPRYGDNRPARLQYEDKWSYGGRVAVTIALN